MTSSPDIRPALGDAYLATFGRPLHPALQIVRFPDNEVRRYNWHGIAGFKISAPRHSAIVGAIVDLDPLRTPQEEERGWQLPMSAWVSRYRPEFLTVYVASGKQFTRRGALRFDESRDCEGLVVSFLNHAVGHRRIPYEVELIPIYSPRGG